jgi:hypothetical protein
MGFEDLLDRGKRGRRAKPFRVAPLHLAQDFLRLAVGEGRVDTLSRNRTHDSHALETLVAILDRRSLENEGVAGEDLRGYGTK